MKIIDNIINKKEQEELKFILLSRHFPWFYLNDISYKDGKQQRPGFSHYFIKDEKINSDWNTITNNIINNSCNKTKVNCNKIIESRAFLQLPLHSNITKNNLVDTPHIDRETKHTVILYYVTTAVGDTIIYTDKGEKKIAPKQGRVVIFDGSLKHTATQPTEDVRCVINININ
mgnify:FL=1